MLAKKKSLWCIAKLNASQNLYEEGDQILTSESPVFRMVLQDRSKKNENSNFATRFLAIGLT